MTPCPRCGAPEFETLPWAIHNPGDLAEDRANVICDEADLIVLANVKIHTASLIVDEHNASRRADQPARVGVDQIADTLAGFFHEPRGQLLSASHAIASLLPTGACVSKSTENETQSGLSDADGVQALPTEAGAEPVAWQWRFRTVGKRPGEWTDWYDGKASDLYKADYDTEERPLYATPPAAPTDNTALVEAVTVDQIEAMACAMWRNQASRAAPLIAHQRMAEAFADEDKRTRAEWIGYAEAALSALAGERA